MGYHRYPPAGGLVVLAFCLGGLFASLLGYAITSHDWSPTSTPTHARMVCTHGLSSVGPFTLRDGKIVGGDTVPRTEACLP